MTARLTLSLFLLTWLLPATSLSQTAAPDTSTSQVETDQIDPCDQDHAEGFWLDKVRGRVHAAACHSARWFDNLFDEDDDYGHEEDVYGYLSLGFEYTEYEGFDSKGRFRLRAPFPALSERSQAFFGRVDEEAFIKDTPQRDQGAFDLRRADEEQEWLLGLGYKSPGNKRGDWDFSAGIRLRTPLAPYVKARYKTYLPLSEDRLLRYKQTFFWRKDRGAGTTSNLDLEKVYGPKYLLRWENTATFAEDTEGVEWWSGLTLYQHLRDEKGIYYRTFVRGESTADVPVQEYGLRATYRQLVYEDWLYLEIGPSLTWPREEREEQREASWGFGVLFEMQFGDYRY